MVHCKLMKHPRIFKDQSLLNEMLGFRRRGWTYDELAEKYAVDRTSIKHWCDQYQLGGEIMKRIKEFYKQQGMELGRQPRILVINVAESMWQDDEVEGKVCIGKSYQEYLEDDRRRSNPTSSDVLERYYKSNHTL